MSDDTTTTTTAEDADTDDQDLTTVATGGDTTTVDLQDLADDLRDEVGRLESLKEQAEGDDDEADDDVEWPPEEYAGVEFPLRAVKHRLSLVESDIERFGGSEFVLRKARAGEAARATDQTMETAARSGADPQARISQQEHNVVQVCVERVPSDAPLTADDRLDTHAMEQPTFSWLKNRVENYNTYGTTDLSDF